MSLVSAAQKQQIIEQVKQVSDTFFAHDITLHIYEEQAQRFAEDETTQRRDVAIKAFIKWRDDTTDQRRTEGMPDISVGYVLLNVQDLQSAGLWASDRPLIAKNQDRLSYAGEEFSILGVERIAAVLDTWTLVKVELEEKL